MNEANPKLDSAIAYFDQANANMAARQEEKARDARRQAAAKGIGNKALALLAAGVVAGGLFTLKEAGDNSTTMKLTQQQMEQQHNQPTQAEINAGVRQDLHDLAIQKQQAQQAEAMQDNTGTHVQ